MPTITDSQILFTTDDRNVVQEVTTSSYDISAFESNFNNAIQTGDVQSYFKSLEEMAEKDPDILQALESRTSEIISKEWVIEGPSAVTITEALNNIKGDRQKGLITFDGLLESFLRSAYLTGLSMNEIVSDEEQIVGFNHIPSYFLTFHNTVYYPDLWTQERPTGIPFNSEKMIAHYLHSGELVRGYLGHAIALQYLLKKDALDGRVTFQDGYGQGFLFISNMGGSEGAAFDKDFETAQELIENLENVKGVAFSNDVEGDWKAPSNLDGEIYFKSQDDYKKNIVKIILGQTSTSDSDDSNRSTAEVHKDVLEQRILEDIQKIEDTINTQLLPKVKTLLNISESDKSEFKFVRSELEEELDESTDESTSNEPEVIEEAQGE